MMISDKIKTTNDSLTIYRYDNGYMVEASGRDADDDWKNVRICVSTIEDALVLVTEFASMTIND